MAKRCGQRVEVLAGRSENTQVFANPDGTSTFTSTAVPVRVHRSDGSWVPVDTTLRARPDGSVAPVATVTDMVFSGGGSGPFATYRDKESTLTVGLPVNLPKPRLVGDTAIYADVLPGIDLRVTASATTFRHVLVVKTMASAASLGDIGLVVGGNVVVTPADSGRVRFADATGRTVAVSEPATMWDSSVNPGEAGEILGATVDSLRTHPSADLVSDEHRPGLTARSAGVTVRADSGGHGIHLTPDAALIANPVLPLFVDPRIGPPAAFWAYTMSSNYNYSMDGKAWVGLNPGDGSRFRGFFQFPTTFQGQTYKGKHIISATFSIMLYHSWSCSPTPVTAYSTLGIYVGNAGRMDFNARPLGAGATFIGSASGNANKAGGCGYIQGDMLMTFGGGEAMRSDVQRVADGYGDAYAIGLCACDSNGANESSQDRWKKFWVDGNTTMSVLYNTVPGAPASLSPYQGQVACGGYVGTTSPVLQAQYVDADASDTLSATFNWQAVVNGAGTGTITSIAGPPEPAGNSGSVTLNLGSAAENKTYQFQVRTYDGNDYSPWSLWCQFTVNTLRPLAPIVTPVPVDQAPTYVGCDLANVSACSVAGGPGMAGGFSFAEPAGTAGQDVVRYTYGWASTGSTVNVAAGAASPTIMLTPPHYGLNQLNVASVDAGGLTSDTTSFYIMVGAPTGAVADWPLDSIDGHFLFDQVSFEELTASGLTWTDDVRYVGAQGATFSNGAATNTVSTFDTSGSFSVAAWVRPTQTCTSGDQHAVSIDGVNVSAFYLGYECSTMSWRIRVADQDVAAPSFAVAAAPNNSVGIGKWTFLVGTYDENENRITLWVNGTLVATSTPVASWVASHGSGWKAGGPVAIARGRSNGADAGWFSGQIADVALWNRVITTDDITGADPSPNNGQTSQHALTSPLSVGSWQFNLGSGGGGRAIDDSLFARPANLVPFVIPGTGPDLPAWQGAGHDTQGGLQLDGVSGYASTTDDNGTATTSDDVTQTILRTDQSVTLSAWVNLRQLTDTDQVVLHEGAVNLMYHGNGHVWAFTVQTPNGSGGYINDEALANQAATAGTWVFLVGEFDVSTGSVRLWVDGQLQNNTSTGAVGFYRAESLTIGSFAGVKPFGGAIDEVQVFQGLLNSREITNLKQYNRVDV